MISISVADGLHVSPVVFGAGRLHHSSPRHTDGLLESVADLGITHIDTAPSYGHGLSEARLRPTLRRHRDIGVTTKVGLYSPVRARGGWPGLLALKAMGRVLPQLTTSRASGSVGLARKSLDASLRALGRDRVEVLMIHEPDRALMRSEEWKTWLQAERQSGRIGSYGLAGRPDRIADFASGKDWMAQTEGTSLPALAGLERTGPKVAFAYGVMRGAGDGNARQISRRVLVRLTCASPNVVVGGPGNVGGPLATQFCVHAAFAYGYGYSSGHTEVRPAQ